MNFSMHSGYFQFEEKTSSENCQGLAKILHWVLFLLKFLQTKPQVKNMNINSYDLYKTII